MPLYLLGYVIGALLSVVYPIGAFLLFREWGKYRHTARALYAQQCLHGAIALVVVMVLGRYIFKFLLSKWRKKDDHPKRFKASHRERIKRPDGSEINIEYYGKPGGDPILLVHGWNTNLQNWYYQKKYFEPDHPVILMDLPGSGRSTRAKNRDYSFSRQAADINAVIEHTGVHDVILWGHSIGGMAILTLLAEHRDLLSTKVKGVILTHTTYANPLKNMRFGKLMRALQLSVIVPLCWMIICLSPLLWISKWMNYLNGYAHILARWFDFTGTQSRRQLDFSARLHTRTAAATAARAVLATFRYDVENELHTIDIPTLIIAAHKDRLTKPSASKYMKDRMPHARLTEVFPGSHQGLLERHKEVNAAAENFIKSLK